MSATSQRWADARDGICEARSEAERRRHERALYELAVSEARQRGRRDAEDFVHDLLVECWGGLLVADNPRAWFRWLYERRAISAHRSERVRRAATARMLDDLITPEAASKRIELHQVLRILRGACSSRDLQVFAKRLSGMSTREVAQAMDLSSANIDQIVSRARRRLRERLDGDL